MNHVQKVILVPYEGWGKLAKTNENHLEKVNQEVIHKRTNPEQKQKKQIHIQKIPLNQKMMKQKKVR